MLSPVMAQLREKGKIPHAEWSTILTRHKSGESLASIARDYKCTAPAIRYIIRRQPLSEPPRARPAAVWAGEPDTASVKNLITRSLDAREHRRDNQAISPELHRRITKEISFFLAMLDAALTNESEENLSGVAEAADRLMRATARVRLELERRGGKAEQ